MESPIWAVCLYDGIRGEHIIEFVRADDRDDAEAQAFNLNEYEGSAYEVTAVAQMPEEVF